MNQKMTEREIAYMVSQLESGAAVLIETDDRDGRIAWIAGIENQTSFGDWQAERAERRASTH